MRMNSVLLEEIFWTSSFIIIIFNFHFTLFVRTSTSEKGTEGGREREREERFTQSGAQPHPK